MPERPLLICDLDETLIDGNSFRLLVLELARPRGWWSFGPAIALHLGWLIAMRAAGRLDRLSFKRRLHANLHALPTHRRARITDRMAVVLHRRLRGEVLAAVREADELGYITCLATAAFDEHARPLAAAWGFDHLIATTSPSDGRPWVEVRSEAKRDAVAHLAADLGPDRPWILLSDHEDDEPLADLCDEVFWVHRRTPLRPGVANEVAFGPAVFSARARRLVGATERPDATGQ
jgi:phosphoserine phosphatase